ncbi:hypothetical protein LEMLEM_LOCUS23771, partial [Lemmus lemmus]
SLAVAHTFNSSTQEAETGASLCESQACATLPSSTACPSERFCEAKGQSLTRPEFLVVFTEDSCEPQHIQKRRPRQQEYCPIFIPTGGSDWIKGDSGLVWLSGVYSSTLR